MSAPLAFTLGELRAYLTDIFPETWASGLFEIEAIGPMEARLRLVFHPRQLRPGGTISGPSLFALADLALYVAILAEIGRSPLAVTTNLNINFLRKPAPGDVIGEARLMKLGKRLAVGEAALRSAGDSDLCAHAVGTYSIPPRAEEVS
ncbi:MAG: PaaI family thioesterase [Hyphomicrobiales bacterium]|nr:PaaI family thioesterase [Hyphomicrobiales bacterium]MBV8663752.1 PaaI family thioesterase [Hyphomicrobiales bacterium]